LYIEKKLIGKKIKKLLFFLRNRYMMINFIRLD